MRAMPSPTSSTLPVSCARMSPRKSRICASITETISSALNLMTASLDELFPKGFQPGADRGVVQPIADAHHHAADQVGVELRFQDRLELHFLPQDLGQLVALRVGERKGAADLHADATAALVAQVAEGGQDGP